MTEPQQKPRSAFGAGFSGCLGVGAAILFVLVAIPVGLKVCAEVGTRCTRTRPSDDAPVRASSPA
jgi:hypothetical protein